MSYRYWQDYTTAELEDEIEIIESQIAGMCDMAADRRTDGLIDSAQEEIEDIGFAIKHREE